jgi:predicted  nucleic acid-binding Zn-ribbon protein
MDWLEPLEQNIERIRQETIKIREETEKLREENIALEKLLNKIRKKSFLDIRLLEYS